MCYYMGDLLHYVLSWSYSMCNMVHNVCILWDILCVIWIVIIPFFELFKYGSL